MEDIKLIYYNHFGTSFFLKRCPINQLNKIQLVCKKTAFDFTNKELVDLHRVIKSYRLTSEKRHSLNTESELWKVVITIKEDNDLHLTFREIKALKDLIRGTLFHLNFNTIIRGLTSV